MMRELEETGECVVGKLSADIVGLPTNPRGCGGAPTGKDIEVGQTMCSE